MAFYSRYTVCYCSCTVYFLFLRCCCVFSFILQVVLEAMGKGIFCVDEVMAEESGLGTGAGSTIEGSGTHEQHDRRQRRTSGAHDRMSLLV
ncbi:hypothetical protein J1N35_007079 [Gossypium stocksii]|uniref:Uncharacterized protein n=1 Tax=Gossypium stocksii TaxID=47602 RepID=A0A9D4AF71_9ROSI|nr:hypothetical protein J1N35_007079 [Gossypium stocksii]